MATMTVRESAQVEEANASGLTPVVFVHGLWLLPTSWDPWTDYFRAQGFAPLTPGWPDDPDSVDEANARPEAFAGKTVRQIADHYAEVIGGLDHKPVVIGHSFGGMITEIVAGRGLAAASVAISPAPFRGVLPLPFSALKVASVALRNPANYNRAVKLTYDEFRYGFGNAVSEQESRELYARHSVAGPGRVLFQAATANLNPATEAKVDTKNPQRGPLLIIAAEHDHTVPPAIAKAEYRKQRTNLGITEYFEYTGKGHSLTIDAGWQEVADRAMEFARRFTP